VEDAPDDVEAVVQNKDADVLPSKTKRYLLLPLYC
jgi:hypothetical protein